MSVPHITVRPTLSNPTHANVYRKADAKSATGVWLGELHRSGNRHVVTRRGENEARFWFGQLSHALRYLITGEPGDEAHVIVSARGDASSQVNAPAASYGDAVSALADSGPLTLAAA